MLRVSQTAKGRLRAHVFRVKVKRKGLNTAASQFEHGNNVVLTSSAETEMPLFKNLPS
jgi:hypothetical protein